MPAGDRPPGVHRAHQRARARWARAHCWHGSSPTRDSHAVVAFTDSQALGLDDLQSPKAFYQALARSLAEQIRPASSVLHTWNDLESPNTNFSRLVQRLLGPCLTTWCGDSTRSTGRGARLRRRTCSASSGRGTTCARSIPSAPWGRLTLVFTYGTECHLVVPDVPEPPFDVGVRTTLADFEIDDVGQLDARYGSPVQCAEGLTRLMALVGGHPYLLQCAFEALRGGSSLAAPRGRGRARDGPAG